MERTRRVYGGAPSDARSLMGDGSRRAESVRGAVDDARWREGSAAAARVPVTRLAESATAGKANGGNPNATGAALRVGSADAALDLVFPNFPAFDAVGGGLEVGG